MRKLLLATLIFFLSVAVWAAGVPYTGSVDVEDVDGLNAEKVPFDNTTAALPDNPDNVQDAIDKLAEGGATDAFTVKVDSAATAGYIGAGADGVLRAGTGIAKTDGGDYVTLSMSINGLSESVSTTGIDAYTIPLDNAGTTYKMAWAKVISAITASLSGVFQAADDDLTDLADGELTGSKLGECSNSKGALPTTSGITDGYVPKKQTDGSVAWEADSTGAGGDQLVDIVATSPLLVNGTTNVNDALPGSDADITFSMPAATNSTPGHMTAAQVQALEAIDTEAELEALLEVEDLQGDLDPDRLSGDTSDDNIIDASIINWISPSGVSLADSSPDGDGEIGYASNAFTIFANSESLALTASEDTWTFGSGSGVTTLNLGTFAITNAGNISGGDLLSNDDIIVQDDIQMDSDAAVFSMGEDNEVTITHVADTGLLLNTAMQWQFRDSAIYINSGADGYLDLEADTGIRFNGPVTFVNEGDIDLPAGSVDAADMNSTQDWSSLTITMPASTTPTASANPYSAWYDSDAPGSALDDKYVGGIDLQYDNGAEDAEDGWMALYVMLGGTKTEYARADGVNDRFLISKPLHIATTQALYLGSNRIDNGSDKIDGAMIEDDGIDSAQYVAGSIDAEHLAADVIDETKLADDSIDSEHYNDDSIDAAHISDFYAYELLPMAWTTGGISAPDDLDSATRGPWEYRTFASDADEDVNFIWQIPSDATVGASANNFWFRVHYLITASTPPTTDEGVAFSLAGVAMGDSDATNASKGAAVTVTDDLSSAFAQWDYVVSDWSGAVTLTGSGAGEMVEWNFERTTGDAADDYAQLVGVAFIEIRYVKNPTR